MYAEDIDNKVTRLQTQDNVSMFSLLGRQTLQIDMLEAALLVAEEALAQLREQNSLLEELNHDLAEQCERLEAAKPVKRMTKARSAR